MTMIQNKDTKITAVIKADGYGHGAISIGQTLLDNGANRFAVATLSEAIQLRSSFLDIEIMVLGYTPDDLVKDILSNNIIQTVYTIEQARLLSKVALELNQKMTIHIKIDSGMNRLGMQDNQKTIDSILEMSKLEGLIVEGIFTHFAMADEID